MNRDGFCRERGVSGLYQAGVALTVVGLLVLAGRDALELAVASGVEPADVLEHG